jgi:pyruvate dehydrogenase E2 component (dihydrolipoamide acetyltransferase)
MSLLSRNVRLGPPLRTSSWRKIAIGTWQSCGDPSVYSAVELEAARALDYIERKQRETGERITLTHFVGKAVALVIAQHPEINCLLRFGRLYPRQSVDVFFQVASDKKGKDLSGTTIRDADKKAIAEFAREMHGQVRVIREQGDPGFKKMKKTMGGVPGWATRYLLNLAGFVMYTLNLWSPLLGSPRDPFGSVMITNIGSLGLDFGFAPLVPYSRIPMLIAVGNVRDQAIVKDGQVRAAPVLRLCVTIDHRLIDGMHASHMSRTLHDVFADPDKHLGS